MTGNSLWRAKLNQMLKSVKPILPAWSVVFASLVTLCLIFWRDTIGAITVWIVSPTFNHCFLIVPLCFFLIWMRRDQIADIRPRSDYRALIPILPLTAAWAVLSIMSLLELEQFLVLTIVQCVIFGLIGEVYYRRLLGPFLYLYFLVPSGAVLIPALQSFTAKFAVVGLHILGIPVFSNGAIIDIPAGTFAVAEACAGLRFLIASVAFGVFFSFLTYRSFVRRGIFIALSVIVPVIANGFRALGLIAAAEWVGSPSAVMADHLIYGWVFFSLVLIILILVGQRFSDMDARGSSRVTRSPSGIRTALPAAVTFFGLSLFLAALGPVAKLALGPTAGVARLPALPALSAPWTKEADDGHLWTPLITGAAQTFQDDWSDGSLHFDRYVAIYGLPGQDAALVRSSNRDADEKIWTFNSTKVAILTINGREFPLRASTWFRGPVKRVVWSYFEIDGQMSQGGISAKLRQLKAYLEGDCCLSAYVAVSAIGNPTDAQAAMFLAANRPLRDALCGISHTTR